ncbi:MAG TPA: hypothetical protein DET40_06690 [Lentisphaeria bacterium]|nr:MAG: hypothetical protein A2X45_01100 [Lentisphaerae bacterium GWF2_50_93]HCE43216.1 hypothetical protein [Lentisphaeria bacterium]
MGLEMLMKDKRHKPSFSDSVAAWQLGDLKDSSGRNHDLVTVRKPSRFVKLVGKELKASLARGGDGHAAKFARTGWLSTDEISGSILKNSSTGMSISCRIKADKPGGVFRTNIFSLNIHDGGLLIGWLGLGIGERKWYVQIPFGKIEFNKWYDLVFRFKPGMLEVFANGSLMDSVRLGQEPCAVSTGSIMIGGWRILDLSFKAFPEDTVDGIYSALFTGLIDHVALWNRAITDSEIGSLSAVKKLNRKIAKSAWRKCLKDYQEFHEASVDKDIKKCEKLGLAMRKFMARNPHRPTYHLTAPIGWLLDPAGSFCYKGKYHVYSYRNIFSMLTCNSLDHYVSDDMIHWKDMPVGVWADSDLDRHGIWLANNFIDDKGVPSMLYTAHGPAGKIGVLARSHDNMLSFNDKEPVITGITHHDGHTWKDGDTWYTITTRQFFGKGTGDKGDSVIILSSNDIENWTERGELFRVKKFKRPMDDHQRWGFTEFPYLIPFGDKYVFMTGTHPVMYWVGRFDRKDLKFIPDHDEGKLLDYLNPLHCFSPMTVDSKGPGGSQRRIIYAMYLYLSGNVEALPWNGIHVLPRVLTLEGEYLKQEPVPEARSLRGRKYSIDDCFLQVGRFRRNRRAGTDVSARRPYLDEINAKTIYIETGMKNLLREIKGDAVEIIADFEPGSAKKFGLKVRISQDGKKFTRICCDMTKKIFSVGGGINIRAPYKDLGKGPLLIEKDGKIRIHVFLDKGCFEVFINGLTCSGSFNADPENTGLDIFSDGGTAELKSMDIWQMKSAWKI